MRGIWPNIPQRDSLGGTCLLQYPLFEMNVFISHNHGDATYSLWQQYHWCRKCVPVDFYCKWEPFIIWEERAKPRWNRTIISGDLAIWTFEMPRLGFREANVKYVGLKSVTSHMRTVYLRFYKCLCLLVYIYKHLVMAQMYQPPLQFYLVLFKRLNI